MTTSDHEFGQGDCGANAAAYLLGALESGEAETFRRHLTTCVVCRDEVATLQAVADALPVAAPQQAPPRRLKRAVMSSIRKEPRTREAAARRRLRFAPARLAFVVSVALIAAAAIGGGIELSSGGSGGPGGVRVVRASVLAPGASAVVRLSSGHAELIVRHLPAPPVGKIYEVWLERNGGAPSPTKALFGVTSTGAGAVDVPGNMHGVSRVLVTPEPLGGSPLPTHAPVIVARLS
jgi:anti-sigma-K factor RskA